MARPKPSSAANGRLSHGPATEAGKNRCRFNAVVHGLTARKLVLLKNDSRDEFYQVAVGLRCTFTPRTTAENAAVESIIADEWRMCRARALQTAILQEALDTAGPEGNPTQAAFGVLAGKEIAAVQRYETTLGNSMDRTIRRLAFIRKNFPDAVAYDPEELDLPQPVAEPLPEPEPQAEPEPQSHPARTIPTFAAASTSSSLDDRPDPHLAQPYAKAAA